MFPLQFTMGCLATKHTSKTAALTASPASHSSTGPRRRNDTNCPTSIARKLALLAVTMTILHCLMDLPTGSDAAAIHTRPHLNLQLDPIDNSQHNLDGVRHERTRLRKRHSDYVHFHALHDPHHVDWQNPCNGTYEPISQEQEPATLLSSAERRALRKHLRKKLRQTIGFEYLQLTDSLHAIDTRDMKTWGTYKRHYRFLPSIERNSSVQLPHWYRSMQVYVASFAHLGRVQYQWDHAKTNYHSNVTVELSELFHSARSLLCEIETTINGSFPNGPHRLTVLSRADMEATLNFYTNADDLKGADRIDLRFVKHHYIRFLKSMIRVLPHKANRKQRPRPRNSSQSSSSMSLENGSLQEDGSYQSFELSASESVESSRSAQEPHTVRQSNNKARRNKRKRLHVKSAELPQMK